MTVLLALIGIVGAVTTGVVTWLVARRQRSGRINTTEAETLWEERRLMAVENREANDRIRADLLVTREELAATRKELAATREESAALRAELAASRIESAAVRNEIVTAHVRVRELEVRLKICEEQHGR